MTKIQLTRHLNKQIIKFSKQAHKSEGEWKCHTHGKYNYTKTEVLSIFLILISWKNIKNTKHTYEYEADKEWDVRRWNLRLMLYVKLNENKT